MQFDDVTILAQKIRESEKLSAEDARRLKKLCITLRNPVLPQHEIETRAGSRPPTHEEIERFEQIATIRKGSYHPIEDKVIRNNWKAFCTMHQWDSRHIKPFLLLREGNKAYIRSKKQRRRFIQFLVDGLPNRTLYSVYHRFRNIYADRIQRRFHPDEDKMILNHLENNENLDEKRKYSDLAKVLKRTRASIWRRYKLLVKKRQKDS